MTLPRWLARLNRRMTNPLVMRVLGRRVPAVIHRGRTSGRGYRTPVAVFMLGGRVVIPLTYGHSTEWARNVMAAHGCLIEHKRGRIRLERPEVIGPPDSAPIIRGLPAIVRFGLWVLRARVVLVGMAATGT